jgi:hypothetical protein
MIDVNEHRLAQTMEDIGKSSQNIAQNRPNIGKDKLAIDVKWTLEW